MTTQEKSEQGFWQSLFGRDEGQEPFISVLPDEKSAIAEASAS